MPHASLSAHLPSSINVSSDLIRRWWHDCSSAACRLPQENAEAWFRLINQVVRFYRLFQHSVNPTEQRTYRSRCRHALAKARWELMLLAMVNLLNPSEMKILEELQVSLERSLEKTEN
jgi:hypothetical protein